MYDVIVIGGGPAGLAGALTLGRALKKTLVLDNETNRNRVTQHSHGFLTQDGVTPSDLRQKARADVAKYDQVSFATETVTRLEKVDNHFVVKTETASYQARKILLAMGFQEKLPDIKGLEDVYGKSVFYCPWCDGYELRNRQLVVAVPSGVMGHMSKLIRNWSKDLVFCALDGQEPASEVLEYFQAKNISLETKGISEFVHQDGNLRTVRFEDGTELLRNGGFIGIGVDTRFDFLEPLALEREETGKLTCNNFGETSVPGLFVAGEAKGIMPTQLIDAASDGNTIAKFVAVQIIEEDDNQ
ncbi:NAD(P)/FAD-dependent oxidoreductase [Streptococcus pluranimalium]|uniref:NAD(P)/FAD-dependent oxidoreductase n=1 Tax=Streptococcus pluranimalium TaxID=82348 RepID=UPI0040469870